MHIDEARVAGFVADPQAGPFQPCCGPCGVSTYHNILTKHRRLIFVCRECGTLTDTSAEEVRAMVARDGVARGE